MTDRQTELAELRKQLEELSKEYRRLHARSLEVINDTMVIEEKIRNIERGERKRWATTRLG